MMEVDVGFPSQGEIMTLGGLGFKGKVLRGWTARTRRGKRLSLRVRCNRNENTGEHKVIGRQNQYARQMDV